MTGSARITATLAIQPGRSMPGFALPDAAGAIVRLKAFKQRRPVLIAVLHEATCPHCRAWLAGLAAARDDLASLDVQPLAIFPDEPETLRNAQAELGRPGALLADRHDEVRSRFLSPADSTATRAPVLPVLLVAVNRYSYCLDAWLAEEPTQFPELAEPLATFAFAEQDDCACRLPIWPQE